jgi:hypothetical protein
LLSMISWSQMAIFSNDEIYDLAIRVASYKERSISNQGSLVEIRAALSGVLIPLSMLRKETGSDSRLEQMYKDCMTVRLRVRKHPLNRLV